VSEDSWPEDWPLAAIERIETLESKLHSALAELEALKQERDHGTVVERQEPK
jgi:hypothetical protein